MISLTSNPENAVFGKPVAITCEAIAVPIPSYTIIHNNTEIVSYQKSYNITVLEQKHIGSYECIVANHLGNSSKIFSLSVAGNFNFLKIVVPNGNITIYTFSMQFMKIMYKYMD